MNTCKFCKRKGTHSFGWLDRNGKWQDKHYTCGRHAAVSASQQQLRAGLDRIVEQMELPRRPVALIGCSVN